MQRLSGRIFAALFLMLFCLTAINSAQKPQPGATPTLVIEQDNRVMPVAGGNNLFCAGYVETAPVDTSYEIVGAQNEKDGHIYAQGDYLYLSFGASRGAKIGDVYSVIRPRGQVKTRWTDKQNLGFYVQEVGAVELIGVKNDVSVAKVKTSCDNLMLGDLLQPIPNRINPMLVQRPALNLFADIRGKNSGRIFMARDQQELLGQNTIVYIDLGAEDNVKPGDYLTIYRSLGTGNIIDRQFGESISARDAGFQSSEYRGGRFSNQAPRKSGAKARGKVVTTNEAKEDRPSLQRILGEMVIINVKEKTATALITRSASEIHTGDKVAVQ